jgi:SAM-dependent methyltransferase
MTDILDKVRDHYGANGLTERLRAALAPEDQPLSVDHLAGLDQFHTRGLAGTSQLASLAGIDETMAVLDVGSGIGGPARYLAATRGCRMTGIDLSAPFVEAARYLTERTGQKDSVSFAVGSALDLPFEDATFDVVLLQHVAMNIADRAGLYRELKRVLRPAGRLAISDIVQNRGDPLYPLPWARTPETSFLLTAGETQQTIEQAGFRAQELCDDSESAKTWSVQLRDAGPPPGPNLGLVMGPGFRDLAFNLGRSFLEDRLGLFLAVFEAI